MAPQLSEEDWKAKDYEIMDLFSPGTPIDENELFAGRQSQIDQLIETVFQRGHHAIIYGEPGVGKTSLARTFHLRLLGPTKSYSSVMVNCDPSDNFASVWRKIFVDLSDGDASIADQFGGTISPDDVRRTLDRFGLNTVPIIIIDEFNQLKDPDAGSLMANTIKTLSDYSSRATLIIVGVANSVSALIAEHASISRALVQIQMPRMKPAELQEIIEKRLPRVGMRITRPALAQIITLSRGLPHYTHLLGQYSARRAIAARILTVDEIHVDDGQKSCLEKAHQSIREQYHAATQSPRAGNIYKQVLLGCALAETDDLGFFPAKAVVTPLSAIMKAHYDTSKFGQHLKILCDQNRGGILELTGEPRRFRYRFIEPLMQPYIIIRGLAEGLIDKATLSGTAPNPLQPRLSDEF